MDSSLTTTVLITGVSSGIGLALAEKLIDEGCMVIGTLRKETLANELTQKFGSENFKPIVADLIQDEDMAQLPDQLSEILGDQPLNILINNAGIAAFGPMEYFDIQEFNKMYKINVLALLNTTQIALPFMKRDPKKAKIINISSGAGKMVRPILGAYAATKHAVEALSDAFRRELQMMYGIQTVVIQAGPIKTAIWAKAKERENPYAETEYGKLMSKTDQFVNDAEKIALPVEKLSALVWKIIQTKRPKTRYLIAPKKVMFYLAMYVLPDRILDRIFTKQIKAYLKE